MLAKPDKWKPPEFYADEKLRSIKLYCDVHWTFGDRICKPNCRPITVRQLKPDIAAWLDNHPFAHRVVLGDRGRSRVVFEQKAHAMLFKLAWT